MLGLNGSFQILLDTFHCRLVLVTLSGRRWDLWPGRASLLTALFTYWWRADARIELCSVFWHIFSKNLIYVELDDLDSLLSFDSLSRANLTFFLLLEDPLNQF